MATATEIQTAYKAIYRADLNVTVATAIANTGISLDAYIAQQLPQVASTTQAAVAIASFVTGTAPTSAKLDELKVAADAQVASYTQLGVGNPSLGAYEAFGRSFATDSTTTAGFNTKYGALSTADFITLVYAQVYGTTPSAGAAANLTAQINYFTNLYTANNVPNAALAAKGAVLGQIVGYAFTSSASANSTLDNQVQSLLTSAAKGDTTVYAKALPVVVDPGQVGVNINLASATDTVGLNVADPALKSTNFNDTITAAAGNGLAAGVKLDGAAGDDTLNVVLKANYKAATGEIVNIEAINLTGASANEFDFDDKVSGVKSVGFNNVTTDTASFKNVLIGTSLSVTDTDTTAGTSKSVVFGFKAADVAGTSDSATLTVNGLDTITKTVTVEGIETLNINAVTANSTFKLVDTTLKTLNITAAKDLALDVNSATVDSITATGAGKVTLTNVGDVLKTIDGSTGTGGLIIEDVGNAAISIKGGSGADTFKDINANKAVVTAGAGNDTIEVKFAGGDTTSTATVTGGTGGDAITLTNGKVTVVYTGQADSTNANFDTLTAFTSGSDKINLAALSLAGDKATLNTFNAAAALADGTDYFGGKAVAYGNFAGGDYFVLADVNNNGKFDVNSDLIIKVNNGLGGVVIGDFLFT